MITQNTQVNAPRRVSFTNQYVRCTMDISADWSTVHVSGAIFNPLRYQRREVIAANPIDRMTNYSGSGLPFPCSGIAMDGTPNFIEVGATGLFSATFAYPNAFYAQDAFEKVPPSIFVRLFTEETPVYVRMELPEPIPTQVRTLTHRENRAPLGPEFYSAKRDIIGVQSAYDTMVALRETKIFRGLA